MNITRLLVITLLLFGSAPGRGEIPIGKRFDSPNGRYSVRLVESDREIHFAIHDRKSKVTDSSIRMPTVLLYLRWGAHSKAIVTVEHIARGSYGRVIYLQNEKWMNVEVNPPPVGFTDSAVIALKIRRDIAHLRFVATHENERGYPLDYALCSMDVSLKTGAMSTITQSAVSQNTAYKLLTRKRFYDD